MSTGPEKKLITNKQFNPMIVEIIIKRHWKSPVFFVALFSIIAYLYVRYTKPMYETKAVLQIVEENKVTDILGKEAVNVSQGSNLTQEVELLRSELLINQTIEKLGLHVNLYAEGKILTKDLYRETNFSVMAYQLKDSSLCGTRMDINWDGSNVVLSYLKNGAQKQAKALPNKRMKNEDFDIQFNIPSISDFEQTCKADKIYLQFYSRNELLNEIKSKLTVVAIDPAAKTIEITFQHTNPKMSFDITNTLIDVYLKYQEELKKVNSNKTIDFIEVQLDSLSRVLKNSKDSLTQYQKRERIPNIEEMGSNLSEKISDFSKRILEIDEELSTLYQVQERIKNDPNRLDIYKLIPEMVGKKSFEGAVMRQIEDLNTLLEKKEELLRDVTLENEQIKRIDIKIQNRISSIRRSMKMIEDRLKSDRLLISGKLGQVEGNYYNLPEKTMELDRLKYLQDLNNRYFTLFTEKKVAYELSNAGYSSTTRVLTAPKLPASPISPNAKLIYTVAIIFGIFCGMSLMIWRYLTYNDIINAGDLQKILPPQTNFLGAVPLYKRKMKYSQVVVTESSKSRMAESIRSIRANMGFINKDAKVIAVSSSISGEGKTFVILNLAGLIAANGKRTVVIDLDLRKPKVHHGFMAENNAGMSNVISGLATLDEVIVKSEFTNLHYITAGPIPPNPSELIQSQKLKDIIEELKDRFDIVMIDNPPVGIVSDGIEILANADIPIYVFKANYSKRVFVHRVEELFKVQKLQNLNVILNGIEMGRSFYGYGYGYGSYGYGDSGYYTDDDDDIPLHLRWWKKIKKKWKSKKKK